MLTYPLCRLFYVDERGVAYDYIFVAYNPVSLHPSIDCTNRQLYQITIARFTNKLGPHVISPYLDDSFFFWP